MRHLISILLIGQVLPSLSAMPEAEHALRPPGVEQPSHGSGLVASPPPAGPDCPRRQGALSLFHIPKAASVFAEWVWAYGCPWADPTSLELRMSLNKPLGRDPDPTSSNYSHVTNLSWVDTTACPCLAGSAAEMYHHLPISSDAQASLSVGLFRRPMARLVSAFHYGMHVHRMSPGKNHAKQVVAVVTAGARAACARRPDGCDPTQARLEQLVAFARLPQVEHTATIMLNGVEPGFPSLPRTALPDAVATALRRVGAMRFVGLTECMNESAALFHAQLVASDDVPFAPPYLRTVRASPGTEEDKESERLALLGRYRDEADEAVFMAAAVRFFADLQAHSIAVSADSCRHVRDEVSNATLVAVSTILPEERGPARRLSPTSTKMLQT